MKTQILITFSFLMISGIAFAQAPQALNYQAIARDEAGNILANWDIGLRISIVQGDKDGANVYTETQRVKSNVFGLINLVIGKGDDSEGDFESILWSENRYYIKIEMDTGGGGDYKEMGTSALYSVPYALYAEYAGNLVEQKDDSPSLLKSNPQKSSNTWIRSNGTPNSKLPADDNSFLNVNIGNVGVGTSSPTQKLDVNGNINITSGSAYMIGNITVMHNMGEGNFFLGDSAGSSILTGQHNTACGYQALYSDTTGNNSVAYGYKALYSQTGRSSHNNLNNTAIGYKALFNTIPGFDEEGTCNVALGHQTLYSNTIGLWNTANGAQAMYENTEGYSNTAIGFQVMYRNTEGDFNNAIGGFALFHNTTGSYNIGIGVSANYHNREGSENTIIGFRAGYGTHLNSISGNVFIGYKAGYYETGDNKLYIENTDSSTPLIWGDFANDTVRINGTLDIAGAYHFPDTDGTNGQVLQTDGSGTISWEDRGTPYTIGDFAHGGIVFWLDETGQHGLVCAKQDQSAGVRWYAGSYGNTRAYGDGPLAGEMNTSIIISAHIAIGDDGETYAARICNELQVTEGGKTYGDWYLPSKEELNLMYQNKTTIDGTAVANGGSAFASDWYWSSTEHSSNFAQAQHFSSGNHVNYSKYDANWVRSIRAF